jgi:hypothetical protein
MQRQLAPQNGTKSPSAIMLTIRNIIINKFQNIEITKVIGFRSVPWLTATLVRIIRS